MPRSKSFEPKYRLHKSSGSAYVCIEGTDVWLGKFGTVESRNKYHAALSEWHARGRTPPVTDEPAPPDTTVSMVLAAFLKHAADYYGPESVELYHFKQIMRVLRELYGHTPATEFGPLKLKAVRAHVIRPRTTKGTERPGWARSYANHQIGRAKMIFKWAVENELVPAAVHHGLIAVAGLRRGRSEARETMPVTPVPDAHVDAVRPLLPDTVRAIVDLQLLTGARPGELCNLRTCDVDTAGPVWVYRPATHKTSHHGHAREIFIGPKAQEILSPLLKPDLQAYVFSPADSERARAERLRAERKTPVQPSQVKRASAAKRRRRHRAPTDRYDVASYRRAIARACERAFPPPAPLTQRDDETAAAWRARLTPAQRAELRAWRKAHTWHPHQLRHNAATRLRREYGLEAAQVILGHTTLAVTEIYAERNVAAARKIMGEVG